MANTHTHTLTHKVFLVIHEHREDAVGGTGNGKHTHTQCPRDTQGGWSLRK